MQPHEAERRHLERQIAYARPIFMVLALVDLLERPPADRGPHAVAFVTAYFLISIVFSISAKFAMDRGFAAASLGRLGSAGRVSGSTALGGRILVRLRVCRPGSGDPLGAA